MSLHYWQHIYVSKLDIKIVCSRETVYGYHLLEEPYKIVSCKEKMHLSRYIVEQMFVLEKCPKTDARDSDILKRIAGEKGFRKFSKKHLCIVVELYEGKYTVENWCRLPDGSYGADGKRWEEYMQKYECSSTDMESLDKNIAQAIEDGEAYLKAIGSHL